MVVVHEPGSIRRDPEGRTMVIEVDGVSATMEVVVRCTRRWLSAPKDWTPTEHRCSWLDDGGRARVRGGAGHAYAGGQGTRTR
jgi:hypothetical protein